MSAAPMSEGVQHFGRFAVSVPERRLWVDGEPVALGGRAFDLLAALVARRDRVVHKDELIDAVWPGLVVEDNNLNVQISALRKVLGAPAIATVPGRGYQFTVAATSSGAVGAPVVERRRAKPPERTGVPRRSRLLVADDNKVNRLLLCRSLELMGHEVESVDNGRRVLERLAAERFDLLLLDLEMPELDGFAVLERRAGDAALREVPVIVTSSVEGVAQVARCIELGADDYLHKPVNPVLLKARVDSSLERKHLRDRQHEMVARLSPGGFSAADTSAGGALAEVTMLAARLHGFGPPGGAAPDARETLDLLSNWTTLMLEAIEEHGGRVHQIGGDAVSAVFGAPGQASGEGGAAWAAARAALEMLDLAALFDAERAAAQKRPVSLGIGLASGEVVAGFAGSPRRAAYVCIGPAVQRAAELEARAARLGVPVLADGATHAALAGRVAADEVPAEPGAPGLAWSLKAG